MHSHLEKTESISNMAASKIALVLVLVAASALGWENLPSIPANRRAEYFLQHDDGAYKFGYDTGEGQSAQATADAANQVKGQYSYVDEAGQKVNWQYTAGDGGFVPVMGAAQSGGSASEAFGARTSGFGSRSQSAHSGVVPARSAYTGASSAADDADFDENADASYNFNIDTDSYKRSEVADAKGNIQGQYSYSSPVGGSHAISYIAGEGTGFVVTSDASSSAAQQGSHNSASSGYNYQAPQQTYLPPSKTYAGASSDGQTQVNPDGSFAFSYTTADHNHQAVADAQNNVRGSYSYKNAEDGQTRKVDYVAGSSTGYVASGSHLPVSPSPSASAAPRVSAFGQRSSAQFAPATNYAAPTTSDAQSDGSYSFSYQTDDHSHHAASDPRGNVAGSFSYVADDGVSRKIDYTAGADQGFVVKGAHLPVAPVVSAAHSSGSGNYQASSGSAGSGYQYAAPAASGYSGESDDNDDGSYSYSYNTGSSSKQESADAKGNVAGSFTYLGGDGVNRKLSYTARAQEGFVVQGDHLPVAPAAGSGQEVGVAVHSAFAQPASYSSSVNTRAGSATQGSSSGTVMASKDGAYAYSYSTGGQSSAAPSYKSASASQNAFNSGAIKSYSAPSASSSSHGSSSGQVMASKDGAYSYSYSTGGQNAAAPSFKSSALGQNAFGSSAAKAYSSPSAASGSQGSSSGQVMASKDGAYSYSYSTGGQNVAAPSFKSSASGQNAFGSAAVKAYSSPSAVSGSQGSSSGQVMASKDGDYSYSYSTGGQNAAAPSFKSSASGQNAYGSGAVKSYSSSNSANAASGSGSQQNDGSYSFSYDAGTHNHEQVSDPQNNVRGSYSYKSKDDGQVRKIEYTAGADTGFVVKGAHLPVAPASGATAYIGGLPAHSPGIKAPVQRVPAHGGGYTSASQKAQSSDETGDASYSYSYKTDTSSKEESSDAQGNVVGSFSYVGGDGVNRKLSYTAKNEAGFNAAGDHLPVVSSTGSGSQFGAAKSTHSFGQQAGAHGSGYATGQHNAHAHGQETRDGNLVISKYLPPVSSQKFGYVFDTKA